MTTLSAEEFAQDFRRALRVYLGIARNEHEKYTQEIAVNFAHFCKWNVTKAWKNDTVLSYLEYMEKQLAEVENDEEVCSKATQWITHLVCCRMDLRLESSTAANREQEYHAQCEAFAELLNRFDFVIRNMKENQPTQFSRLCEMMVERVTRSY